MLRADDVKEEFLTCCVCTKQFDEETHVPRVLPCLHTFCQVCLRKIVNGNILVCPYCKTEYLLPPEGIYVFPKDTTRRNLIEFCRVKKKESDILCKDCPDDNIASDFCKECYIFMCMDCTHAHRRSLASRSHYVVSVDNLQTNSEPEVFQRVLKCTQPGHEGQPLTFYCAKKGCEKLVCTSCTVCDHDKAKGHILRNVKDVHSQKQTELAKIFKMLEEDVEWAKALMQQSEQKILNVDIKEFELEKDIETSFTVCQRALESRKQELKTKMSRICASYKSTLQTRSEKLESFIEDVQNAQEFSKTITLHSDPTEFLPLHVTLYRRLKVLVSQRIKSKSLQIEEPSYDAVKMDDFQRLVKTMGQVSSSLYSRKHSVTRPPTEVATDISKSISRGHTDIALNSTPRLPPIGDRDVRFGEVTCPEFIFEKDSVHHTREVSDNAKILRNYVQSGRKSNGTSEKKLKRYRGVIGNKPFQIPGKVYFEVMVDFLIIKPVDNSNFIYEIGLSRMDDIDNGYYVYDKEHAWSLCVQHCEEHKQLCQWCRHNDRNHAHVPLSPTSVGTTLNMTYGFLLDTDRKKLTIQDCSNNKKLYCYHNVDASKPLWPVFGCHWPSKMKIEMSLQCGKDIACSPHLFRTTSMII